jgi:hypothetical protein
MEITRNPLCWPENVARTAPHSRCWPLFHEKTIAAACSFLRAEVNRLNGYHAGHTDPHLIISSNLRLRLDGQPVGDQVTPPDPGIAVYFKLRFTRGGKWHECPVVLTCDAWLKPALNIDAIARDIEAQRARKRYGCTNLEQAFRGYLAIPERCGARPWWEVLKIKSDASRDQVKDQFKQLSKTFHPDKGGSREDWNRLQEAYDQALSQIIAV